MPELGTRLSIDFAATRGCGGEFEGEIIHISGHRGGVGGQEAVLVPPGLLVETPLATGQGGALRAGAGTEGVSLVVVR